MILRRLKAHVEAENWFAVAIDFAIVVVGVFIGIQVANWNDMRADRQTFEDAMVRFVDETKTNLETLDALDAEIAIKLDKVGSGYEALLSCADDPETLERVNIAINELNWTYGLPLRRIVLDEIATTPRLLQFLCEDQRQRLADAQYKFGVYLSEARHAELSPLQTRMETNPVIAVGDKTLSSSVYLGVEYTDEIWPLSLAVPVSEACQDNNLVKDFYAYLYPQGHLPTTSRVFRTELEKNLEIATP